MIRNGASCQRRLVLVSPTFAPEVLGTPLYSADIARWFTGRGWAVQVVTAQPFYPEFKRYPGYRRARRHDTFDGRIPVFRLPTFVPRRGQASLRVITDLNFALQGVIAGLTGRVKRSDYVLSVSPGSPYAVAVANRFRTRGGRHIAIVHDVQSGLASGLGIWWVAAVASVMRRLERHSLNRADQLLTLSKNMRASIEGLGVTKPIEVLPLWRTVEPPERPGPYSAEVQFSGNLGRKQGLDDLVALVRRLECVRPGTRVVIRGSGPLRDQVRVALADEPTVRFDDPVPHHRLGEALAETPLHIVTQLPAAASSALPSKIFNALSVGGIIVAFAPVNSPVAHLAQQCAAVRIVPPGDLDAAASTVAELLDSGALSLLSAAAQHYAATHHDRDTLLGQLESMLLGESAAQS